MSLLLLLGSSLMSPEPFVDNNDHFTSFYTRRFRLHPTDAGREVVEHSSVLAGEPVNSFALRHVLELLALRLLHESKHEEERKQREYRIEAVRQSEADIGQGWERRRDQEVADPLSGRGKPEGGGSDPVVEHLTKQHPDRWPPRDSEENDESVSRDKRDRASRVAERRLTIDQGGRAEDVSQRSKADEHARRADQQQPAPAEFVDHSDRDQRDDDVGYRRQHCDDQ